MFNLLCHDPEVVSNIAPRGIVSVIVSLCMYVTFMECVQKTSLFTVGGPFNIYRVLVRKKNWLGERNF